VFGSRVTFSPGGDPTSWSVEPGLFTPQAGVSATYGWRLFNAGDLFR